MFSTASTLVLASGLISAVAAGPILNARDGPSPGLPTNPDESSYCSWWADVSSATTCSTIVSDNWITLADFQRWVSLDDLHHCWLEVT